MAADDRRGSATLPTGAGTSIRLDPGDILDALNFGAMGMFSAERGRWGVGTDLFYADLSSTSKNTRQF